MERRKIDDDARRHAEHEKLEGKVQQAHAEKEQAEREAITLRARLQNFESLQDTVERERNENSELRSKVQQLEADLSSAISQEQVIGGFCCHWVLTVMDNCVKFKQKIRSIIWSRSLFGENSFVKDITTVLL
jgi:hypothetical protein